MRKRVSDLLKVFKEQKNMETKTACKDTYVSKKERVYCINQEKEEKMEHCPPPLSLYALLS